MIFSSFWSKQYFLSAVLSRQSTDQGDIVTLMLDISTLYIRI